MEPPISFSSKFWCFVMFSLNVCTNRASLMAQFIKKPPAMQETQVLSLGWEDPLEKVMATSPVFLPRESHG